ncbi:hypothetical protein IGI04_037140 [Brassica rapa subsp. trilocularis]|uniref:Uncharacterized protein n=1 Tax=Brassica rapa subsp. trilocularis TaxID=1813537 RepID=A0ABQ7LI62_BRACM|nr:hypothetical protein IGI04_037140 [Brassica rapa subsp. trilocularis]
MKRDKREIVTSVKAGRGSNRLWDFFSLTSIGGGALLDIKENEKSSSMGSKVSDPRGIAVRQNGKVIGDFGNLVNIPTGKYAASGGLKDVVNGNIDALDDGDKLAVVEYADDIFKFYKSIEEEGRDYMGSQPELNIKMRSILIVDMGWSKVVGGPTLCENPFYVSPNQIRALEKRNKAGNFAKKIKAKTR